MKRMLALALSSVMAVSLCACGDSSAGSGGASGGDGKVAFTIFNSKSELQENFEELAEKYSEENNVDIEVYYSVEFFLENMGQVIP